MSVKPTTVNVYTQGTGTAASANYHFPSPPRDPTSSDYKYPLYSRWVNTDTHAIWYLESFSASGGYINAQWRAVAPIVISDSIPTSGDYQYPIGQTWVVPSSTDYWVLVAVSGTTATWTLLSTSPETSIYPITPYTVGPVHHARYQTVQEGINAANAAGGGVVYIQPGAYTEDLTLYDNVDLYGTPAVSQNQGSSVSITGTHTPPASGHVGFNTICFISTTDVFSSAAAGTTHLVFLNCESAVENGHFLNLLNWTGILEVWDNNPSTAGAPFAVNDGGLNNTGGASLFSFAAGFGSGSNTMTVSGLTILGDVNVGAPVVATTGAIISSYITTYGAGISLTNTSALTSNHDAYASPVASAAIVMNSAAACTISNAVISSTNNPAIDGSGAGTLDLSGISFSQNSNIAGTVTLGTTSSFLPGPATPYGVLCGGTTNPGVMQSVASVGSSGQVLQSAGAAALPTWQDETISTYSEQQTFTPTISGTTLPGAGTYTLQAGYYTRLQNLVFCQFELAWTAHTGTGNMTITDLPFICRNSANFTPEAKLAFINVAFPASTVYMSGHITPNTSTIEIFGILSNAAPTALAMDTSGGLHGTIWYLI